MSSNIIPIRKVKLISGLLSPDNNLLVKSKQILIKKYGPIDLESPIIPFTFTNYYNEEIGEGILRQYISFTKLIKPDDIAKIKNTTIKIENKFRIKGNRKVNIDPGFVTLDKMVLATTKDATYRIYLGSNIYAQSTLYFENKSFHPWQWTYADYKAETAIAFFNKVRQNYRDAL